ncbi:hypothetical protein [Actinoplanes friuliensis]|uniref:Secreted protein n=1 Tax=Actinoplanes friuliensis DSM 7358 TaxID=1246995 RepID=U5W5I9_9ACTN|nr:hypothetical protein [Actinoplanes friuliensis]AGZ43250.1 hypothetical protein AFR_24920 [Actinoplanes friuliensis DSM 7358]
MPTFSESLPALVGVALGAAGAMTSSLLTDRLRWRRDQNVRWDQRRLEAYTTFAATLKEITGLGFRLSAADRADSHSIPIERELGLQELAAANVRKTKDWESLLLLGDELTVAAAREWRDATRAFERQARAEVPDPAEWQQRVDLMNEARDGFYLAARRSLGIGGGSVEQFPHLPRLAP